MPISTKGSPSAEPDATTTAETPTTTPAKPRQSALTQFTGILLRFISCGLLSIAGGVAWRFTLAPARMGIGSALLGVLSLLVGFIIGGICWYLHDARIRSRTPERVSDEHIVFSFVVFVLVPLAVGIVIGAVWLLALFVGA